MNELITEAFVEQPLALPGSASNLYLVKKKKICNTQKNPFSFPASCLPCSALVARTLQASQLGPAIPTGCRRQYTLLGHLKKRYLILPLPPTRLIHAFLRNLIICTFFERPWMRQRSPLSSICPDFQDSCARGFDCSMYISSHKKDPFISLLNILSFSCPYHPLLFTNSM